MGMLTLSPCSARDVCRAEDLLEAGHKRAVAEEEVIAYAERMDAQVRLRWEFGWESASTVLIRACHRALHTRRGSAAHSQLLL